MKKVRKAIQSSKKYLLSDFVYIAEAKEQGIEGGIMGVKKESNHTSINNHSRN